LPLLIHQAVITLRLGKETPAPRSASGGIIAGVLDTDEYIAGVNAHIAAF